MNGKDFKRIFVAVSVSTIVTVLVYVNHLNVFTHVGFRYHQKRVLVVNTTSNTTKKSKIYSTWWVPLREDTWIDLSQSKKVPKKPTNVSLVDTTSPVEASKTILVYTPFFGSKPWSFAVPSWDGKATDSFDNKIKSYCPDVCRITYDHTELNKSHAIVFHGRDMPSVKELQELNNKRLSHQRWVFYLRESPMNTFLDLKALNLMFNWTITYRLDSDIFQPDHYFRTLESEESSPEINYAEGKDRFMMWAVSNCAASNIRNDIVKKLLGTLPIDIFGGCQGRFGQSGHVCPAFTDECYRQMRRYKFYIAFENSNCYHYVTEKYWENALMNDIVPIVMGGAVLEEKLLIPRTYISILDFPSATSLAEYLRYLDKNDTAYNQFFWYKKHYKIYRPIIFCRLCKKLHDENQKPKVTELFSYWNRDTNCYINESYIRNEWLK